MGRIVDQLYIFTLVHVPTMASRLSTAALPLPADLSTLLKVELSSKPQIDNDKQKDKSRTYIHHTPTMPSRLSTAALPPPCFVALCPPSPSASE